MNINIILTSHNPENLEKCLFSIKNTFGPFLGEVGVGKTKEEAFEKIEKNLDEEDVVFAINDNKSFDGFDSDFCGFAHEILEDSDFVENEFGLFFRKSQKSFIFGK